MIAVIVKCMQSSENGDLQTVCVESLDFMNTLQLSEKRWKNYEPEKAFTRLCAIGSTLHTGTLQQIIFLINIHDVYWAIIKVNGVNRSISYADTLGWNSPTHNINAIRHWLSCLNLSGFNEANTLQHDKQQDSFSCKIAAINTIKHTVFHDPLFDNDRAFSLCMDKFLDLAHDHLEV